MLIGRDGPLAVLRAHARQAAGGAGRLVLITGDAGAGKTALAEAALDDGSLRRVHAAASPLATAPLGPLTAALRELGIPWPEAPDAQALSAEICSRLCAAAGHGPLALILDDLQWSDHATLEMLPLLAERSRGCAILVLALYSSDGLERAHPLRLVRDALRRSRRLEEIVVGPLDEDGVRLLVERCWARPVDAGAARRLLAASGGIPFFVEALAAAPDGLRPAEGFAVPQAIRDAILARFDRLSAQGRAAADAAAVLGTEFDLSAAARLSGAEGGVGDLLDSGLAQERSPGRGTFRPALVREALYESIAWTRRRSLHRAAAQILEEKGREFEHAAEHWKAAAEPARARRAWLRAAQHSRQLHAHRDAVEHLRRALELWMPGDDEAGRLGALDQLGDSAQLCGRSSDALKAWSEIAESTGAEGMARARALRRIANLHELNCDWGRLLAARMQAQAAFASAGDPAEAAIEGITAAVRLRQSSRHAAALEVLERAALDAQASGRRDLQVRVNALRANMEVRLGRIESIAAIQDALSEALAMDVPALAGEIYQRLADAIERQSDFARATQVNLAGIALCEERSAPPGVVACLVCMSWILVRQGAWDDAMSACRRLADMPAPVPRGAGIAHIGLLHALRGEARKAEAPLLEGIAIARRIDHALMAGNTLWGLALCSALTGDMPAAAEHCRALLALLHGADERHACIPSLRWAAGLFRSVGDGSGLAACVEALGDSAARFASPEPLSALAHAMGELAWLNGDVPGAAQHFERAITLIAEAQLPRERVESELRAAATHAALGARDSAVAYARAASKGAERLGARPLADAAVQQLRSLGEALAGARGPRGSRRAERGGLTARQLEVLAAISQGLTDKEVARRLDLSPRTVESHVATALAVLDARSRAEAVRKAAERGLLKPAAGAP